MKKIAILTSGGDGPGMNAAIRSVVRMAVYNGLEVKGVMRGYSGLINDEVIDLNHRSVANMISRGGTFLKTARSPEFRNEEGQKKAVATIKKYGIDAVVVIGGDGSYAGALDLFKKWKIPTIGLPGTIDNDLRGTDQTIGCNTAVNTALDAIDKIRDTAHSMERIFVVEVMGNRSGYIALQVALGSGAEDVIIPERKFDYEAMYEDIKKGHAKGKISWMIIVAEGAGKAHEVAQKVTEVTGFESRYVVLGHIQRGGVPTASDRILATRVGAAAIECLLRGEYGKAVGVVQDKINVVDLGQACSINVVPIDEYYQLVKILT
ncbi:MAG: 6-phosphofructokinase [Candidatus Omnitrophica bacterium]|nr:6-phosphofructokinase [Candidatus Omnitrophota bacterium]